MAAALDAATSRHGNPHAHPDKNRSHIWHGRRCSTSAPHSRPGPRPHPDGSSPHPDPGLRCSSTSAPHPERRTMRTTERIAIGRRSSEVGGLRLRSPVRAKRNRQARQTRDAYEYCRARLPSLRERASACAMRHGVRAWSPQLSGARAPAACAGRVMTDWTDSQYT